MIPEKLTDMDGLSNPLSYGLLESIESRRTDVDGDYDAEYFEDCLDFFPADAGELI